MSVVTSNYTFNDGPLLSTQQLSITPAGPSLSLPVASIFTLAIVGYLFVIVTGIALRHWISDHCCSATDLHEEPPCQCGIPKSCEKLASCCNPQCPPVSCSGGAGYSFDCFNLNSCDCCCIEIHLKNASS